MNKQQALALLLQHRDEIVRRFEVKRTFRTPFR